MASPESDVSRESEELVLSPPNSPEEQHSDSQEDFGEENGAAAVDSPLSEVVSATNGKKEETQSDEEGEASDDGEIKEEGEKNGAVEEGELEEGEVDDEEGEDGEQKSKSQVCKYYYKGQCTWGSHCRFIHPGFVDKGNYNMFESVQKVAPPADQKSGQQKAPPASVQQRPLRTRTSPPILLPPLGLPRLPIIPPDFFPPIPEPPRRETMWEKGVKQARHLAQAAAKKRDAIEDKMHGLADRFDPEFDDLATTAFPKRNGLMPEDPPFPFNTDRRTFPTFAVRNPADFDQMTREREMRRFNNFMDQQNQQNQINFNRNSNLERRRSPPSTTNDLRKNLNEVRNQRQRAADEWQDPWMRSRSPGTRFSNSKQTDRWVRKSPSPRSPSRSGSKISRTSRVSEASEPRKRGSRRSSRSPKRHQVNRAPSGSPISSTGSRSFNSKSPSPVAVPLRQQERLHDSPVSSRASRVGKRSMDEGSLAGRQAKRKHEGSPISSASSVDNDDGPRTPPPDDDSAAEDDDGQGSFDEGQNRRQESGSPISPEHSDEFPRRSNSPVEAAFAHRVKRLKKAHKPIKLTLQLKADRRNVLSAFGPDGDEEEDADGNNSFQTEASAQLKQSSSVVDLDRSSPLSDEELSLRNQTQNSASILQPDSSDKQNKREELLRQLRAVEEAIARKKAVKTTD